MKLSEISQMSVAVWGGGKDGRAAAQHCLDNSCDVVVVSDSPDADVAAHDLARDLNLRLISAAALDSIHPRFLIRSPGVSRYRPEIQQLSSRGIESSNLLALWLADQPPQRIIGVTGTKGKSTTATLIEQILAHAGQSVTLCGNIGVPVTHVDSTFDHVVVEVSSYQASDCTTSPEVGVLTALGEDHIPWHGSVQRYHADKVNVFSHPQLKKMIFHEDDALVAETLRSIEVDTRHYVSPLDITEIFDQSRQSGVFERMGDTTFPRNLVLAIHAAHAAYPALEAEHVVSALSNMTPLPSRQSLIGSVNGVYFVDDALASNPLAATAAIQRFADAPLIMIIGGQDRSVDYQEFIATANNSVHVKNVIVMGDTNDDFAHRITPMLSKAIRTYTQSLSDAVIRAFQLAQPGWRIVFSPAAPTWQGKGDYASRSADFRHAMEQTSSLS